MIDYDLLPNFLIIGAEKSGTTTLYDLVCQHPEIFISERKELNFYSDDERFGRGIGWYQQTYFQEAGGYPCRGEASPRYLMRAARAAERIHEVYRERPLKMIAIFRDPAERAYSLYWHWVRVAWEELSFEEALQAEEAWFAANPGVESVAWRQRRYVYSGHYATQLKHFLTYFAREQFLFLLTEDLKKDFAGTARKIYDFLGADASFVPQAAAKNPASAARLHGLQKSLHNPSTPLRRTARTLLQIFPAAWRERWKVGLQKANLKTAEYPAMNPATRRALTARYRDEIRELESLIGRDLSDWLRVDAARGTGRSTPAG